MILILPSVIAILSGAGLLCVSFGMHLKGNETHLAALNGRAAELLHRLVLGAMAISMVIALFSATRMGMSLHLVKFVDGIELFFRVDKLSALFVVVTTISWFLCGIYAFKYMEHEGEEIRYFGFYLLIYGILIALDFSGNLVTLYFFYELMTVTSMPLVLHNGSREAKMAALKYLFYSMAGAYLALFGIFQLNFYTSSLTFTAGGTLSMNMVSGHVTILLIAVFCTLLGFGTKAGMLPLHGWLPAAHPVAPAPASAVLSSVITKGGVLALIRVVYYIVGPDFIRGTWVQYAWMTLALLTVFMGSMMAYMEKGFKKRLAYSSVSQISYIVFGLSVLSPVGLTGSLLHYVFHTCIKCALFLTAGIFIFHTGKTRVDEYAGIGKEMPITLWCYTFVSLALIGIPPTSGFISKWYLAQGALDASVGAFRYIGPIVLLISALLTAGYLLPITLKGFLPGKDFAGEKKKEKMDVMVAVLLVFAIFAVLLGVLPNGLITYVADIAASVV